MVVGLSGMVVGVNVALESDMVFGILRACTTVRTCIMTVHTVYSIRKDGKEQCTCMYNVQFSYMYEVMYTHRWIYPNNTVICTNYFIIHK